MAVRIYKPARTAMQSGESRTKEWVLEFEPEDKQTPEPLMGWISSGDTRRQVRLEFATKEEAIAFAAREGFAYTVIEPKPRKPIQKSYADNFRFGRPSNWTH